MVTKPSPKPRKVVKRSSKPFTAKIMKNGRPTGGKRTQVRRYGAAKKA